MKFSLLAAALLAASGAIAALWGDAELRRESAKAQQAKTQWVELQRQLASLQDPKAEERARRLAALQAQGFFAEPKARAFATRLQAARAHSDIITRHVLREPRLIEDGALQQNLMELELTMPHEQKFMDFWRALAWPLPLQVNHCDLTRAAMNLVARCQAQWLTAAPTEPENTP
jgi:hypothetical protein